MTADIEFVDAPPPSKSGPKTTEWDEVIAALKANPGRWAKVRTVATQGNSSTVVARLKAGMYGHTSPGEVEAVSRKVEGDTTERDIYARYVGHLTAVTDEAAS